jgi:hypothetical protein
MDGNYGDYTVSLALTQDTVNTACDCPYPGTGCKHTVAALLDASTILGRWKSAMTQKQAEVADDAWLNPDEIRTLALDDRKARARRETFTVTPGEMIKGEHLLETATGRQYTVTLHHPESGTGALQLPGLPDEPPRHLQAHHAPGRSSQEKKRLFPTGEKGAVSLH